MAVSYTHLEVYKRQGESTFNITGSTNLTFKSGTYTGQIWGGSYINGTATAALTGNIGSTNSTITGGTGLLYTSTEYVDEGTLIEAVLPVAFYNKFSRFLAEK